MLKGGDVNWADINQAVAATRAQRRGKTAPVIILAISKVAKTGPGNVGSKIRDKIR